MYDYLNIQTDTFYKYWLENNALDFPIMVSERTGHILQSSRVARDKNLQFKITPSVNNPGHYHTTLSGSLHKYSNQGRHNADTFTLNDFNAEVLNLQKTYDVNPARTTVKSFEFGVNIQLPQGLTPKQVIDSIICMPTKRFIRMNVKKIKLGKMVHFDTHDLKIYDKAGQISDNELFNQKQKLHSNILRIEVRVNKMRFLEQKRYQLKQPGVPLYLSQLLKQSFAQRLGKILLQQFNEIIFHVPDINTRHLTLKQQLRLSKYMQAHTWENYNSKQRYRATEKLNALLSRCSYINIKEKLSALVEAKTKQLLSTYSQNGVQTHQKNLPCKYHKKSINASLECNMQTSPPLKPFKNNKKNVEVKRFCKTCGRDISHQRKGSNYCSEKIYGQQGKACRNAGTYQKRKSKQQKLIDKENKILATLCAFAPLHQTKRLNITLNTGENKRPTIAQVIAWPWNQRRTIIKLTIKGQTLTRSRAKKYVKFLKELPHETN